tara:strand:- start:95 stop:742 length:648 start_codon:yes stop_codon:yes gene_type:complete
MKLSSIFPTTLAASVALTFGIGSADSASFTQDGEMIYLSGPIEEGDSDTLTAMVEASGITQITLESDGGLAVEGYNLGYTIQGLRLDTFVADRTVCLSACAVAFIGGNDRSSSGLLGFHVAWSPSFGAYSDGMKSGQIIGIINAIYFYEMGYTAQLPYIVSQITDSEHFLLLSSEDLRFFEMIDKDYTLFKPLEAGWVGYRLAGPFRLQVLRRNL